MQIASKDENRNNNIDDMVESKIYNTKFDGKLKKAIYFIINIFFCIKEFLFFQQPAYF